MPLVERRCQMRFGTLRTLVPWYWLAILIVPIHSRAQPQEIRVTLLGTGSPAPSLDRFGPSILVEAGDQTLVFDSGRGVLQRLAQVGIAAGDVDAIFLTHLHSDHIVGLPDLWLVGWLTSRRATPWKLFGPAGTARMFDHLRQAFEIDIRARIAEADEPPAGAEVQAADIQQGVIYEANGVKVSAIDVDHRSLPALGYRIDYAGRSVVLSGDTQPSENLIQHAKSVDLLIHEVYDFSDDAAKQNPNVVKVSTLHTSARQAGEVFQRVAPKLAVFSHIVLRGLSVNDLVQRTRGSYAGPLVVGDDLMQFVVAQEVSTIRP